MTTIRSSANARVKAWSRLAGDARERRRQRLALIEGPHLVGVFLERSRAPASLIVSEGALGRREIARLVERSGRDPVVLSDALFKRISDAETPAGIAAQIDIPEFSIDPAASAGCVFLEAIQDAGNVGTILRSAAAFGLPDVILGPGCADPWSPRALRAGMGGHFFLRIAGSADLAADVRRFGKDSLCTAVRAGQPIDAIDLTRRVGWIFGSEGAGVSAGVAALATRSATIPMPGGAESLNVAAAAAICFYERQRQISRRAARS